MGSFSKILIAFLLIQLSFTPSFAQSETRVALVIGNGDYNADGSYDDQGDLLAAKTDVKVMSKLFTDMGFEKVIVASNVTRKDFRNRIREFKEASKTADVAVFYYSGHGLVPPAAASSKKQNYLVPIGVDFTDPDIANDLEAQTVALSSIRREVERPGLTTVFLLDACRNNPFGNDIAKSLSTDVGKSVGVRKGLTIENVTGGESFVAFAARDGEVAIAPSDGSASYFTQALVENINKPDSIQNNLALVRGSVLILTNNRQRPQTFGELNRPLYLGQRKPVSYNEDTDWIRENASFELAKKANSREALIAFMRSFPNSEKASEASSILDALPKNSTLEKENPPHLNIMRLKDLAKVEGRSKQAINDLNKLADNGNAAAKYELGFLYLTGGKYLIKNEDKGTRLIEQAANAGNPSAKLRQFAVKKTEFFSRNDGTAAYRAWEDDIDYNPVRDLELEKTILGYAAQGADFGYGLLSSLKMGQVKGWRSEKGGSWPSAEPELLEAVEFSRTWAKTGSFEGAIYFAQQISRWNPHLAEVAKANNPEMYRAELTREALNYLKRAADLGCIRCLYRLSISYGRGSPLENGQQELFYIDRTIESGVSVNELEKRKAHLLWRGGVGLSRDPKAAVPIFKKEPQSQKDLINLALAYFKGDGVPKDGELGLKYAFPLFENSFPLTEESISFWVADHYEMVGDTGRAQIYYGICRSSQFRVKLFADSDVTKEQYTKCEAKSNAYWNSLSAPGREDYLQSICRETNKYPVLKSTSILDFFECTENGVDKQDYEWKHGPITFKKRISWDK